MAFDFHSWCGGRVRTDRERPLLPLPLTDGLLAEGLGLGHIDSGFIVSLEPCR